MTEHPLPLWLGLLVMGGVSFGVGLWWAVIIWLLLRWREDEVGR